MKEIVKIEHLSHRYNIQWAIRDINMEILERGIYGLLGSNGAGKSTAMNILCGVLKPTGGNVFIKGIDARKYPVEAKRHIGFLPQRPPLHADLTVEEYLRHAAGVRLMPAREIPAAVREVMERCGLTHFSKRLIRNLSGGYQQRVGIAQAIIHRPGFIVLDEPTNGLDPNQIMEIRHLIKSIAEEHTVLLSTHILSEIQATCHHIRMIEEGRLVFAGTVEEFDNYIIPSSLVVSMIAPPPLDELRRVPGVVHAEALGGPRFRVKYSGEFPGEISERIIGASVANGWRLTAIDVEKSSLDAIFSTLSREGRSR
ncbi:MAG: ABC transporter ATP-binding protein [Odoribacteraceae bacterium]|jgi:ABC-2 type transport system ATP-binding protein|nr:ABC transporter ATP-binding protein [Odoribacteraceae bacterium]